MRPAILIALALLASGCDFSRKPGIQQCVCGPDKHTSECEHLDGPTKCHTADGGGIVAGDGCICIGRYYGPTEAAEYKARDGAPKPVPSPVPK